MSVETKGGPDSGPPENSETSEMDTDSTIVNNNKYSEYKLTQLSVSELSPGNEGQYTVACWHCAKNNVIKKFHEWKGLQTKIKQLNCRHCNKRSAVKCFLKITANISNGHLVKSENKINIYSCNTNFCKINKIDCRKCNGQINVKYMPIMGLQSEEYVTCDCGIVNKVISEYKETPKIHHTSAKPSVGESGHTSRRTPRRAFSVAQATHLPSSESAVTLRMHSACAGHKETATAFARARNQLSPATEPVHIASNPIFASQRPGVTTSNSFSSLSIENEHDNNQEREGDNTIYTTTSPKPKKRKRGVGSPNATVTPHHPRVITQPNHIPDIIITDVKKINDPELLKRIRKITTEHGARHAMAPNKRTITIRVYTEDIRKTIIDELRNLDDGLRFIARVPKAQQTHHTKVVLNTNIYDETNEACLEEMERCIGVRPLKMTTIKGNLHLFIFDGAHSYDEIATLMKSTKHAYFGAFSMKPQQYKDDPRRVVQCKSCFLFTHATSACHGEKKQPTSTIQNEEGVEIEICTACKKPGHGANQAKCEKFQKAVKRQIVQHEEKVRKQRETAERRDAALKYRRDNASYVDITSTSQFPSLSKQVLEAQPHHQLPKQQSEHFKNKENSMEPLGQELQTTMKQILYQLQLQHEILIKILNK